MKKFILVMGAILSIFVLCSGCVAPGSRKIVISGKITKMEYRTVSWAGDTVYETTFDNETMYPIRSDDFNKYGISNGDTVTLELSIMGGSGSFYYISVLYMCKNHSLEGYHD